LRRTPKELALGLACTATARVTKWAEMDALIQTVDWSLGLMKEET
jgi:hypothetical protein